jgi:hypothetical protein
LEGTGGETPCCGRRPFFPEMKRRVGVVSRFFTRAEDDIGGNNVVPARGPLRERVRPGLTEASNLELCTRDTRASAAIGRSRNYPDELIGRGVRWCSATGRRSHRARSGVAPRRCGRGCARRGRLGGAGCSRIELAEGIIAHCCEVNHRIDANEVIALDIADIGLERLRLPPTRAKGAASEEIESRPTTSWPACSSMGTRTADVAIVSGDDYPQGIS